MVSKTVIVKGADGLHMRPAGLLASEMGKFSCDVMMQYGDKEINAKSVISIMQASIRGGEEVLIQCDGEDEQQALECAVRMIEQGLGEA